jgi:hypothetical protein
MCRYNLLRISGFFLLVTVAGCHHVKEPVSRLNLADPATSNQLLSGFWWVESNSWRWTARQFSAALQPPDDAEIRGATLYLHLYIPDSQIESLGPMTLCAATEGRSLRPETFSTGGTHIYTSEIPKELMATSILPVKFSFDKAAPADSGDGRELAAIVTGIELEAN